MQGAGSHVCGVYHRASRLEVKDEAFAHLVNLEVPEVRGPLVYIPVRRALGFRVQGLGFRV